MLGGLEPSLFFIFSKLKKKLEVSNSFFFQGQTKMQPENSLQEKIQAALSKNETIRNFTFLKKYITDYEWLKVLQNIKVYTFLYGYFYPCREFINRSVMDALFINQRVILDFLWKKNPSMLHYGVSRVLETITTFRNNHFHFYDTMNILSSIGYTFRKQDLVAIRKVIHVLLQNAYAFATPGVPDKLKTKEFFEEFFDLYMRKLPWYCFKCGIKDLETQNIYFSEYKAQLREKMLLVCYGTLCETSPCMVLKDQDVLSMISFFL